MSNAGSPQMTFTPKKGPDPIFGPDHADPGFREGAGYETVIGGDLHEPAFAAGENSMALGDGARAGTDESDSDVLGCGPNAQAFGDNAMAVGGGSYANGFRAGAVGPSAYAEGDHAFAAGPQASATADRAFAVGGNASSFVADTGVLKANHVVVDPSDGLFSDLTLYDDAGAPHVLAVTDTEVTFDGVPIGGGGGATYSWLEDSGFDLSGMAPTGGTLTTTLVNPPEEYSILVLINGLVGQPDGIDYSYWEDPVGTYNIEIYNLRPTDELRIRYVTAS